MTVGIILFWSPFLDKCVDADHVIRIGMKCLGGSLLILIDKENLNPPIGDAEIKYERYPRLIDAMKAHKDKTFVFIECEHLIPEGKKYEYLADFVHPKGDTIYVVGHDNDCIRLENIPKKYMRKNRIVTFNTVNPYNMRCQLFSHVALFIVMYDRIAKMGVK